MELLTAVLGICWREAGLPYESLSRVKDRLSSMPSLIKLCMGLPRDASSDDAVKHGLSSHSWVNSASCCYSATLPVMLSAHPTPRPLVLRTRPLELLPR